MTNLPPIPQKEGVDRNWSPETWRAGLDEAVRLTFDDGRDWFIFCGIYGSETIAGRAIIAHATTLLDHGIVKPVVSEADALWASCWDAFECAPTAEQGDLAAIAVIQSALDKARSGK